MTRRALFAALAVAMATLPVTVGVEAQAPPQSSRVSASGSYLAARHAGVQRDASAASIHYRAALRADPRNPELLERAFLAVLSDGDIEEALRLADRLLQLDRNNRMARLVVGVRALRQRQYPVARQNFAQSVSGQVTDLTAALLTAWAFQGVNETRNASEAIDRLGGPDWYALFKDMHAGMILELGGSRPEAGQRLERAYKLDSQMLPIVEAYSGYLARHNSREEALKILQDFNSGQPRPHALVLEAIADLQSGGKLPIAIDTPQKGAAEALYGLGAVLTRNIPDLSLAYLQLALYLAPNHPLALLTIGDLYESLKKHELAIKMYERVPEKSPLRRDAEIHLAINLDALDRTEEATKRLDSLIAASANDREAISALGSILRGRKKYAECGDVYSKGIATIHKPEKQHWLIFYFRGICYERSKQWPKAENDFKQALELFPDQPDVLNYLGYSWVDQGVNLDEGMRMIRRAVEQRPDNGYIVDSLGWAYYRIGNYEEAVKHLERAVELRPEDPTINDHLGDAYWRVGRELEAQFQWTHARDSKPEPEDLPKIEEKLRSGLNDAGSPATPAASAIKKDGGGG